MSARVLLLSCYELGHAPLGVAWPQAFLRRAGIVPEVADLSLEPLPEAAAARAAFVAISVPMHTALRLGIAAAIRVRALNPRAHVCFHGPYAWLNADYLLARHADSVVAGEAEETILELVQAVDRGADPGTVPGARTRGGMGNPRLARLDFPLPDRTGLPPLERYARYVGGDGPVLAGSVEASRGCLHTCRHCPLVPVYGGRFFVVPVETVIADARAQVGAGARHLTFSDPDFLNGPGHALRVARALHAELPAVTFDFTAKVEHILRHRDLFPPLRELGLRFVVSAVESLSDTVLQRLHKGHTAQDVAAAIAVLHGAGVALHATLVAFTPWTTLADYIAQVEFFRSSAAHVPPVQLAIRLLVPPGSALLDEPETRGWIGPLDPTAFVHRWAHPDPRMDALYERVARRVAEGEEAGEDAARTWEAVRSLAFAAAERVIPDEPLPPPVRLDPPRLTEHWFC